MSLVSKSPGFRYALANCICLLTSVACGVGWIEAQRESNRRQELNRHLAAEIVSLKASIAASQEKTQEATRVADLKISALERYVAELVTTKEKNKAATKRMWKLLAGQAVSLVDPGSQLTAGPVKIVFNGRSKKFAPSEAKLVKVWSDARPGAPPRTPRASRRSDLGVE